MDFFLDTACVEDIRHAVETGLIQGVTTNPSLLAQQEGDPLQVISRICESVQGPVSVEVTTHTAEEMMAEAQQWKVIGPQIVIKVPLTKEGLMACQQLRSQGIAVNVTLCFSVVQALLAAKAGATYISPFVGRLDDAGFSGAQLIQDIVELYELHGFDTQVLAASLRHSAHVKEVSLAGAHVATMPPAVFYQLYEHPLTAKGLAIFEKDWARKKQSLS